MIGFTLGYTVGAWEGLLIAVPNTGTLPITEHNRVQEAIRNIITGTYSVSKSDSILNTTSSIAPIQISKPKVSSTTQPSVRRTTGSIRRITNE